MMQLTINGEGRELPDCSRVSDLLEAEGIDSPRGLAIAVDGEVIPRSEWDKTLLRGGQRVEMLRAVQGG